MVSHTQGPPKPFLTASSVVKTVLFLRFFDIWNDQKWSMVSYMYWGTRITNYTNHNALCAEKIWVSERNTWPVSRNLHTDTTRPSNIAGSGVDAIRLNTTKHLKLNWVCPPRPLPVTPVRFFWFYFWASYYLYYCTIVSIVLMYYPLITGSCV